MSAEARQKLDLSHYRVTNPNAGLFDRTAVRKRINENAPPLQVFAISQIERPACIDLLERPVIDFELRMPSFYEKPGAWREAVRPLFAFEDAITDLAALDLATNDPYFGRCLLKVLDHWARQNALLKFHYKPTERQAWFNIEDMLFAAGQAFTIVRGRYRDLASLEARIATWLQKASLHHLSIQGGPNSCCNNHFYRRALHAVTIGVATQSDDLFQFGVSALFSALHEMREDGGLPRELLRRGRAVHYQNFALLYLIPIAEIIERQGYPAFEMEIDGRSLADAVNFVTQLMHDPQNAAGLDAKRQSLAFMQDPQYFAWAEIWLARQFSQQLDQIVAPLRPIINRSAVGHASLYFYYPAQN